MFQPSWEAKAKQEGGDNYSQDLPWRSWVRNRSDHRWTDNFKTKTLWG